MYIEKVDGKGGLGDIELDENEVEMILPKYLEALGLSQKDLTSKSMFEIMRY